MNPDLLKDPKVLIIGAVGIGALFLLMKSGGGSSTSAASTGNSTDASQATTPVGGSYSYLDGNGTQHLIATDPNNGALTSYTFDPSQGIGLTQPSGAPVTGLNTGGGYTGLSYGDFQAGHVPLAFLGGNSSYPISNPFGFTPPYDSTSPVDPSTPSVHQLDGVLMGGGSGVIARPVPGSANPTFNPAWNMGIKSF